MVKFILISLWKRSINFSEKCLKVWIWNLLQGQNHTLACKLLWSMFREFVLAKELYWTIWNYFELFWTALNCFELFWTILIYFELLLFWAILIYFELFLNWFVYTLWLIVVLKNVQKNCISKGTNCNNMHNMNWFCIIWTFSKFIWSLWTFFGQFLHLNCFI